MRKTVLTATVLAAAATTAALACSPWDCIEGDARNAVAEAVIAEQAYWVFVSGIHHHRIFGLGFEDADQGGAVCGSVESRSQNGARADFVVVYARNSAGHVQRVSGPIFFASAAVTGHDAHLLMYCLGDFHLREHREMDACRESPHRE
jgi:hypothetical protein